MVATTLPAGMVFDPPVSRFEKVTVPVAFVSVTLRPVAEKSSVTSSGISGLVAGTMPAVRSDSVTVGSATTSKVSAMGSTFGVTTIVAEGRNCAPTNPAAAATTMITTPTMAQPCRPPVRCRGPATTGRSAPALRPPTTERPRSGGSVRSYPW